MAHVKKILCTIAPFRSLIPAHNRPPLPPKSSPGAAKEHASVLYLELWVLLLLCSSRSFFRLLPQGQTAHPCGGAGDQRHITNLRPTEARTFSSGADDDLQSGGLLIAVHT